MKVTVYDVDRTDREVDGQYTIDTTLGLPVPGDEIVLKTRDYHDVDRNYLHAQVRTRRWIYSDNAPGGTEVQLWVQRKKAA